LRPSSPQHQEVGGQDLTARRLGLCEVRDGRIADRIGHFTLSKPSPDRGKFIEVYRRQADGSWKCVGDIFNRNQAAT
jgi:ketosteroid isomerase-like protein